MRSIKFRVFKKETDIMYYPDSTQEEFNHYFQIGAGGFWLYDREGKLLCTSDWGDVLMQYTGLKDKNGKEIYEGDLLKRTKQIDGNFIDRLFEKYEVAYNSSIAGFEYKPTEGKEYKQYTVRPFGGDEIEITGNVHDVNPALKEGVNIDMNIDPNVKSEQATEVEQVPAPTAGEANNLESASQNQAMEVDSEEGTTEG